MSPVLAMGLEAALKSSIVLGVAGGLTWLLRSRTAALRHAIWSGALTAVLLLPVVLLTGPRLRIVPAGAAAFNGIFAGATEPWSGRAAVTDPGAIEDGGTAGASEAAYAAREVETSRQARTSAAPPTMSSVRKNGWPFTAWTGGWLAGVLVIGVWILVGELALVRLARHAAPVRSGAWATTLGQLRSEGRVPRRVRILESDRPIMPLTYGTVRPRVLLPVAGRHWSAVHRRDVLLHELAHVRRRDGLTHGIARLVCALHWFNPLAWFALHRTRVEREHACDDAVLEAGSLASSYANTLLTTARSLRAPLTLGSAGLALAPGAGLANRLRAILDAGRRHSPPRPFVTGGLLLSTLVVALPLAALAPSTRAATDPMEGTGATVARTERTGLPAEWTDGSRRPVVGGGDAVRSAAPSPVTPPQQVICPRTDDGRSRTVKLTGSMSITGRGTASDGVNQYVVWTGEDCAVVIHTVGEPTFNVAETDVATVPEGGRFEIRHTSGATERVYDVRPSGGGVERRYTVNGQDATMDAAFETWRATLVLEFIRRSGWDAEARTLRILDQGGVRAVLDEVEYLESNRVAGTYLRTLLETGRVGAGDVAAVIGAAGTRIDSDRELGRVLAAVPPALLETDAGRRAFVNVASGIESDREKARAMDAVLESGMLSPETTGRVLEIGQTISSDRELGRLLINLAERGAVTGEFDARYVAAAHTLESDREKGRVLAALLESGPPSAATLETALGVAATIGSDRELARLLIDFVERGLVEESLRPAFDAALDTVESSRERDRVLAALGRRIL